MASSINPYNINGNYPVAGQDNDSQGFRDNFTNLRNNLVFAKAEIEDLQRNAVLKSALSGTSLDNNLDGAELVAPQLKAWTQSMVTETGALGVVDINFTYGNFYNITPVGNVTLNFVNFPNSGYGSVIVWLEITNTAFTVTMPDGIDYIDIPGYNSVNKTITFASTGSYLFEISTFNRTEYVVRNLKSGSVSESSSTFGAQDLGDGSAVDLTKNAAYFTTAAAETATLAAGTEGQVIVLAATDVSAGEMVVTVANAAWGGDETITFTGNGQTANLMYINSKWFCIGSGIDSGANHPTFG